MFPPPPPPSYALALLEILDVDCFDFSGKVEVIRSRLCGADQCYVGELPARYVLSFSWQSILWYYKKEGRLLQLQ